MATYAKSIRTFNVAVCPEATMALFEEAGKHNLTVLLGIFIGPDADQNEEEIDTMVSIMKTYSATVQAVVVGSDAIVSGKIGSNNKLAKVLNNVELLIDYIKIVKDIMKKNGWTHPVTTAEGWGVWESEYGGSLVEAIDLICLKMSPYHEGFPIECSSKDPANCISAATYTNAKANGLSTFYKKRLWICETLWPTAGNKCCFNIPSKKNELKAVASPEAATQYLNEVIEKLEDRAYFISSAFDRDWRRIWSPCPQCAEKNLALSSFENGICDLCEQEYQLGIFDSERERKEDYELPSVKCQLPTLPEVRLYTASPPPVEEEKKAPAKKKTKSKKKSKEETADEKSAETVEEKKSKKSTEEKKSTKETEEVPKKKKTRKEASEEKSTTSSKDAETKPKSKSTSKSTKSKN